jgi:L-ascorbate metabolism protein UlaG (beta-lactamase superfamily)
MSTSELRVIRLGHACHLIELGGATVLTDPWFTFTATYDPGERIDTTVDALPDLDAVVITHEHYDHCDLGALAAYRDLSVPLIAPGTVVEQARAVGFTDVRLLEAWDATTVGDLTITAAPGKHGVHEVTFVIQGGGRTVYFGGDTLYIPELDQLPQRFGHIDLALLPVNGLCIRPANMMRVVMDAQEAARLTAVLAPSLAIPHHYAFTSGRMGDQMITKGERDPRTYADAVAELAPATTVRLTLPGQTVVVP